MFSKAKIAILGSGSWATALAKIIMQNAEHINWFFRDPENIEKFKKVRHNPNYLRGIDFDINRISFHSDINRAIEDADIIVLAIPSAFLNETFANLTVKLSDKFVISAIKGIIPEHNLIVGQYLNEYFNIPYSQIGVVTGPCHAEEVALEQLSYLTVACQDVKKARGFAFLLECPYIHVHVSTDIYGTEYSAVLKNIIAIAAGIAHGLRYGDNFQAVLISNAIQEIKRFVDKVHPITRDIKSSEYLGDLLVTAYSQFSRNRTFGTMIGKGYSVRFAQLEMHMIAEGYYAAKCIKEINEEYKVNMPISEAVYNILYENISPAIEFRLLTENLR